MIKNLLQNTTQLAQAIWAHYLSPQLASGAYAAVDATCGRGNDPCSYHCVHTDMCNQPNCPPEILFVTRKKSRGSLSTQDSRESDGNGHAR